MHIIQSCQPLDGFFNMTAYIRYNLHNSLPLCNYFNEALKHISKSNPATLPIHIHVVKNIKSTVTNYTSFKAIKLKFVTLHTIAGANHTNCTAN